MILDEPRRVGLSFVGEGGKLLGIYIVNALLMIVTLGIYYPWGKVKVVKYIASETELEGDPFEYHGTGMELFLGMLKAIGAIIGVMLLIVGLAYLLGDVGALLGKVIYLAGIFLATPYAIHSGLRYRTSRTTWNNVRWGYRGDFGDFAKKFVGGMLLTAITIGIYGAWFSQSIRKYIMEHLRFGNITFKYDGDGMSYFLLNLKGIVLTIFTAGIYIFWYSKELFDYNLNHTKAYQNEREIAFSSTLTGGALFVHTITNMLLIICTLGIGLPWAIVRTLKFTYSNIIIEGQVDIDELKNTEEEYTDAIGEGLGELLDVGSAF